MKLALICIVGIALATSTEVKKKAFSAKLFIEVVEQGASKNIVISPASIYTCLGLAYLGAGGITAAELKGLLELEGTTKEEIAKYYGLYLKKFEQYGLGTDNKFDIASRVYVDKKYEIATEFVRLAAKYFNSTAEPVDFGNSQATAGKINSWVSDHTNHKIKDIVGPNSIDDAMSAILVNAIYFRGYWEDRFNAENTTKKDFFLSQTEKKAVDMMFQENYFQYADWSEIDATAIQIPYVNTDMYMLIILPKSVDGLKSVVQKFKTANLGALNDKFTGKKVKLHLPKFKFEYDVSLNKVLSKLGVNSMFSSNSNFSSLLKYQRPLPISDVKHKAFIEVDEYGTEAAAATMILVPMMGVLYSEDKTVYDFNVDHPFMFAIKNEDTIFFAGQVTNI